MSRLNRYQIMDLYRQEIVDKLKSLNKSVLTTADIHSILSTNQHDWKLPASTTSEELLEFLVRRRKVLRQVAITVSGRAVIRYLFTDGKLDPMEFALSIFPKLYLSHYSAVAYHDLTNEIIKSIYVNKEQSEKSKVGVSQMMLQSNIDYAFSKSMRQTSNYFDFEGRRIYMLNSRFTEQLGVMEKNAIRVTDLERTLIDISVRPEYAGGVYEVLNVFRMARGRVSANKLRMYLQKLNYIYPYHQVIGFYLERAGFNETALKIMETIPIQYDFYLTYNISDKAFSERWRLHYPRNLS